LNNTTTFLFVGLAFVVGSSVHLVLSYAQNTTASAPIVQSSDALITSITGIVIAIAGLITVLVKAGLLDKKVGTVAVMAADASWAVKDNRQLIKEGMQNTYEVVRLASPQTAEAADQKLVPLLDDATRKVNEYTPKVEKFADIANKLSKNKADEITALKDEIPDRIVPS
jgi:hypothetical protein